MRRSLVGLEWDAPTTIAAARGELAALEAHLAAAAGAAAATKSKKGGGGGGSDSRGNSGGGGGLHLAHEAGPLAEVVGYADVCIAEVRYLLDHLGQHAGPAAAVDSDALSDLTAANEKLVADLSAAQDLIKNLGDERDAAASDAADAKREAKASDEAHAGAVRERDEAAAALADAVGARDAAMSELETLRAELATLSGEREGLGNRLKDLEAELERAREDAASGDSDASEKIASLEARLRTADADRDNLRKGMELRQKVRDFLFLFYFSFFIFIFVAWVPTVLVSPPLYLPTVASLLCHAQMFNENMAEKFEELSNANAESKRLAANVGVLENEVASLQAQLRKAHEEASAAPGEAPA